MLKSSASTLSLPLSAAAPMHFYHSCDRSPQSSWPFSPLDLHEQNDPLRGKLAADISLAFARSLTPCLIYQCQQAAAAFHPLHQGNFGSGQQTSPPSRAVWLPDPFARSIDEIRLKGHGGEETERRFVQKCYCGSYETGNDAWAEKYLLPFDAGSNGREILWSSGQVRLHAL